MKRLFVLCSLLYCLTAASQQREYLWPEGRMPDMQSFQIAAMTDEVEAPGFNPDASRIPYLDWFPAPEAAVKKDVCMILISGGSYQNCCDVGLIRYWQEAGYPVRQLRVPDATADGPSHLPDGLGRRSAGGQARPERSGPPRIQPGKDRRDFHVGRIPPGLVAGYRIPDPNLWTRGRS